MCVGGGVRPSVSARINSFSYIYIYIIYVCVFIIYISKYLFFLVRFGKGVSLGIACCKAYLWCNRQWRSRGAV